MNYFPISDSINEWSSNFRCPFGVHDLSDGERCGYIGCQFFVKYSWLGRYDHHLVCSCNLPKVGVSKVTQLTFDF